ncbi:MAG: hypothetical protein DRG63_12100 [Deltaproteobacteria bacterium]|nr:MAG: hypothetical protein DRG63_12100 [Deltaproteobacteria bacterium]
MMKQIGEYLDTLKVGRKQVYRNLAMFPLLSSYRVAVEYVTLDEAIDGDLIEVAEVDEEGSVPELRVKNRHSAMVLIMDGEELVGAKQNRIVNTTILLPPKSTTVIPVSCVEQGRWHYEGRRFRSENRMLFHGLRAAKAGQVNENLRARGAYLADQGFLWEELSRKASRMKTYSPTGAMADIYEGKRGILSEYIEKFPAVSDQVGAIFMINGKVAGMDAFGRADTFEKVFSKLLDSYALDALDLYDENNDGRALKSSVTGFLKSVRSAEVHEHPSVGAGTDCRIESRSTAGFALALDGRVIHMSVFRKTINQRNNNTNSRMQRFSQRRENRLV